MDKSGKEIQPGTQATNAAPVVYGEEFQRMLGVRSRQTFTNLQKDPRFLKPLPLPGRKRWARSVVEEFIHQRDIGEVVVGAHIEGGTDLSGLTDEQLQGAAIQPLRTLQEEELRRGHTERAEGLGRVIAVLEGLGPWIVESARRFSRSSSLADYERPA